MKRTILAGLFGAGLLTLFIAPSGADAQASITEQKAHDVGVNAYLYFYPLVTMDVTRKQFTNIEPGKEPGKGPMKTVSSLPEYPPADLKAWCVQTSTRCIRWLGLT